MTPTDKSQNMGAGRLELYSGRDARLVFTPADRTDLIVITFSPLGHSRAADAPGFGEGFLLKRGYSGLHFISSWDHWWQIAEMDALLEAATPITQRYPRIITYGASMGAYGALAFSSALGATHILAFSPQYTIDPDKPPYERRWKHHAANIVFLRDDIAGGIARSADARVFYDRFSPDQAHIELLRRHDNIVLHTLPFAGHGTPGALATCGLLSQTIVDLIEDRFDPVLLAREYRLRKRETAAYWFLLADYSFQKRRYALARRAVDRALDIDAVANRQRRAEMESRLAVAQEVVRKIEAELAEADSQAPRADKRRPRIEMRLERARQALRHTEAQIAEGAKLEKQQKRDREAIGKIEAQLAERISAGDARDPRRARISARLERATASMQQITAEIEEFDLQTVHPYRLLRDKIDKTVEAARAAAERRAQALEAARAAAARRAQALEAARARRAKVAEAARVYAARRAEAVEAARAAAARRAEAVGAARPPDAIEAAIQRRRLRGLQPSSSKSAVETNPAGQSLTAAAGKGGFRIMEFLGWVRDRARRYRVAVALVAGGAALADGNLPVRAADKPANDMISETGCVDDTELPLGPASRDDRWATMAENRRASVSPKVAEVSNKTLMLLGDSIAWRWTKIVESDLDGYHVINFGVSGDRIEHLLWRLQNLHYAELKPHYALVIIGTNNLRSRCNPRVIADGVLRVVREFHEQSPHTRILVMSLLPRGPHGAAFLPEIKSINAAVSAGLGSDGQFLDIFDEFYRACAAQEKCDLYEDYVHPNDAGYADIERAVLSRIKDGG
jgi:lysophospholipase L1-like esterase